MFQGCFREVLRMLQGRLGGVPRDQWSFKLSVKCVSRKFQLKVSRVFQKCFKEVFFCNFVLACISSQLPEQKEGLFIQVLLDHLRHWALLTLPLAVWTYRTSIQAILVSCTHTPSFQDSHNLFLLQIRKAVHVSLYPCISLGRSAPLSHWTLH